MRAFNKKFIPVPSKGPCVPLDSLKAPFDLEVGCGTGDFAMQWAAQTENPVIAIEKTRSRFLKFEKKYKQQRQLKNLWPVHTNAVWWLTHYGKKNSFERVFLMYPNTYPKARQAHLRWINRPFMPYLLDLLMIGGLLELRTNRFSYYEEFKEKIQKFSFIRIEEERKVRDFAQAQSLFEKKYLDGGEECHVLICRKT